MAAVWKYVFNQLIDGLCVCVCLPSKHAKKFVLFPMWVTGIDLNLSG